MTNLQTLDLDYLKGIAKRVVQEKQTPRAEIKPVVTPQKKESKIIAKVNPRDYIHLGLIGLTGQPICISMTEIEGSNNKNYEDTHKFLLEQGLYMPTPQIFMHFFKEVISANKGKGGLYYADGFKLSNLDVNKIFKNLTSNYNNKFRNMDMGSWTWLNSGFIHGSGCMGLDLETVTGLNGDGNLKTKIVPLEECMDRDTFVELDFNTQGLPKYAFLDQYKSGKNIYFYGPRKNCVAKFGASSGRASLDCDRNPADTLTSIGSFACFEVGEFK